MGSVSIWDEEAALQSCWFDCESHPTAAYSYPSNDQDFRYLTGYRWVIMAVLFLLTILLLPQTYIAIVGMT